MQRGALTHREGVQCCQNATENVKEGAGAAKADSRPPIRNSQVSGTPKICFDFSRGSSILAIKYKNRCTDGKTRVKLNTTPLYYDEIYSISESTVFPLSSYEEEDMDHLPPLPIGHN